MTLECRCRAIFPPNGPTRPTIAHPRRQTAGPSKFSRDSQQQITARPARLPTIPSLTRLHSPAGYNWAKSADRPHAATHAVSARRDGVLRPAGKRDRCQQRTASFCKVLRSSMDAIYTAILADDRERAKKLLTADATLATSLNREARLFNSQIFFTSFTSAILRCIWPRPGIAWKSCGPCWTAGADVAMRWRTIRRSPPLALTPRMGTSTTLPGMRSGR